MRLATEYGITLREGPQNYLLASRPAEPAD